MAGSVIGALRVNLGLDSAQFERGAKRVKDPLRNMRRQFQAISAAAAAAGAAVSAMALKGGQEIDKSAKAARRLGSSVGGFRALELAADEAGVSLSTLTNDVQTIDREIASIGKSGNAQRALDELGLSIDDLAGKDADEKLATIADRVQELGLTTGETTSILRDLGVRNREMVLLVSQGGDALRQARKDIEEYGLALSQTDSAAIEQANDRMSRLGLISQYLRQRLAVELVPAMGEFAQAMTDSLREGGRLRAVIDGLVDNLGRMAAWVGTAVAIVGVRYVAAFAAATAATVSLSGALVFLKGAIARTGIGLLVVGAGELVYWLARVVSAAGGIGEALRRVYEIGKATLLGVGHTAWGLLEIMAGVASAIVGSFTRAFAEIAKSWDSLVNGMGSAWNAIADTSFGSTIGLGTLGRSNIGGAVQAQADAFFEQAIASIEGGGERIANAGRAVAEAFADSMKPIGDGDVLDTGAEAADRLAASLDGVADSAGGAADKVKNVKDAAEETGERLAGMFSSALKGAKSLSDFLSRILSQLADMLINSAFSTLFSGGFGKSVGGFLSGILDFDGGGFTGYGARAGGLDGKGGMLAMVHPNETVIDHTKVGGFGGGGIVEVVARVENGSIVQDVRRISGEVAVQTVREGLAAYDRHTLPGSVGRIRNDPTRRG